MSITLPRIGLQSSVIRSVLTILISWSTLTEQFGTTPPAPSFGSTTTEIDHFDRDHPVNLTCIQSTPYTINASWSLPNHENQTELENFVLHYYRSKYAGDPKMLTQVKLEKNVTAYLIDNLKPGLSYSFQVIANYTMGHQPHSIIYTIKTMGYGEDRPCDCNQVGTKRDTICNKVTGQCECNKYTKGRQCDHCIDNYIWTRTTGCHPCNCNKKRSNNTCYVDESGGGGVKCHCLGNFGGDKCDHCALSFYKQATRCLPCHCNNNTDPTARACDAQSGVCIRCLYNTTGDHCERCLDGYQRDTQGGRGCTQYVNDVPAGQTWDGGALGAVFHRNLGAVVGGCVGVLLFVLLIVAVVVYRRWWRWRRRPLQFWTVQLKEDHERVSFSADHPAYQHVDGSPMPDDSLVQNQAARPEGRSAGGRPAQPRTHGRGGYNPYHSLQET